MTFTSVRFDLLRSHYERSTLGRPTIRRGRSGCCWDIRSAMFSLTLAATRPVNCIGIGAFPPPRGDEAEGGCGPGVPAVGEGTVRKVKGPPGGAGVRGKVPRVRNSIRAD